MTTPPHNNTPDETASAMAVYRRLPVTADGVRVIPTMDWVWNRVYVGHNIATCYFHRENIPQETASE